MAKKTLPTMKSEDFLEFCDQGSKGLKVPPNYLCEFGGKTYKIRKETINGALKVANRYNKKMVPELQKHLDELSKVSFGKPPPKDGEVRSYKISANGFANIPIKYLMKDPGKDADGQDRPYEGHAEVHYSHNNLLIVIKEADKRIESAKEMNAMRASSNR